MMHVMPKLSNAKNYGKIGTIAATKVGGGATFLGPKWLLVSLLF